MSIVHDGASFPEPHDCIIVKASAVNPSQIWQRDDPYWADAQAMADQDGIDLDAYGPLIRLNAGWEPPATAHPAGRSAQRR